jgi:hypothetical protein
MGGMCITMDFLMMIFIEPYHCNMISAMQLAYILSITATFRVWGEHRIEDPDPRELYSILVVTHPPLL